MPSAHDVTDGGCSQADSRNDRRFRNDAGMLTTNPLIVVRNQSKLSTNVAWKLAWVLHYYVQWQLGPIWKVGAEVKLMPADANVPLDAWIIDLLNTSDEPGALGYHDEEGNERPFGRVFVETAEQNNLSPSEVLTHEAAEMLGDPHVNLSAFDPNSKRLYAVELCDACQGGAYDLAAPYNRPPVGYTVADFVRPSYFDPKTDPDSQTDYRGILKGPFSLASQGYVSYATALPPEWQQAMGDKANPAHVDADDRVARRGAY